MLSYKDSSGYRNIAVDFEYKDIDTGAEIDYVDYFDKTLLEITVSDKTTSELHFNKVSEFKDFKRLVTTKSKENTTHIPYYKYILELSRGYYIN